MTLFLTSAYLAIRARANSLVRLENEEIDALLQGIKPGTELGLDGLVVRDERVLVNDCGPD